MFKPPTREVPLIPRIGSFELYTEVPADAASTGPVVEFYWRDKRNPVGRGPFTGLWACMEDFKSRVTQQKSPPLPASPPRPSVVPKSASVVNIDFVLKRRL